MDPIDVGRMARLIYKQLTDRLTDEEEATLCQWREADERHEAYYQRLIDPEFLQREYLRLREINPKRPMEDMRRRVGHKQQWRVWTKVAAAACLCALLVWGGSMYYQERQENGRLLATIHAMQIRPGQMQATLVIGGGEPITLGSDSAANSRVIARQKDLIAAMPASEATAVHNTLTTPRGGEFKIVLEDSTEVWLNAESKLIYPEKFGSMERRVAVVGEAYLKVRKDTQRPFYVETDGQLVRVYGTELNIRSYEEDGQVYTTLVSGQVSVARAGYMQGELVLTPGHQALFDKQTGSATVRSVNAAVVTSWKQGMFVFEEQTLEQIMQCLCRWYDFGYRFMDDVSRQTIFMGSIPRYAEFEDVVKILEKSGGLRIHVSGRSVTIQAKKRGVNG